eukprot:jgi/Pico_ML_1/50610/g1792.t1
MHRWTSETTPNGTKQDASANSVPKAVESPLVRIQKALFCSPVKYPYEFNGGHVKGAINLFEPADVEHAFLSEDRKINRNTVVVFHCEFSSQRAPKMYGHIRNLDRKMNLKNYPKLDFPHMYIMDGGYKDFFSKFEDLCEGGYTMMCDLDHGEELKACHTRYKSLWQDRGMSHRGSY